MKGKRIDLERLDYRAWDFAPTTRPSLSLRRGGGHVLQAAVAAQNSYAFVFNESVDQILYIRGVHISLSLSSFCFFEVGGPGLPAGSTRYVEPAAVPAEGGIDPRVGQPAGQLFVNTLAACVGTHIGGVSVFAGAWASWQDPDAIGIVLPGNWFALQVRNVNITLEASISWDGKVIT
jgi:hypothetical protein